MMDPKTGTIRVRYVDVESEMYQTLAAYMIRLKPEDFEQPETIAALAKAGNLDRGRVHPPLRRPLVIPATLISPPLAGRGGGGGALGIPRASVRDSGEALVPLSRGSNPSRAARRGRL